jgi:transposase
MADASPEIEALRTALAAAEARAATAEARASEARAMVAGNEAVIATLKLEIEKLKRVLYGQKSERRARLLDQLELRLEELEAAATEDELAAEKAAAQARTAVRAFERRRPARKPFPAHLPRERVVIGDARGGPPPVEGHPDGPREVHATACAVPPDSARLGRPEPAGDDPVREVRPAPAAEPPGRALCPRGGGSQPFDARDQVGACAAALAPLHALIEAHVMAAERLHGDDTTVPVLAKGKTAIGRLWVYVRDDRPFAGGAPPAALFRFSRDRKGEHPERHLERWSGLLQADAYAGFRALYADGRSPGPIHEALVGPHRRPTQRGEGPPRQAIESLNPQPPPDGYDRSAAG